MPAELRSSDCVIIELGGKVLNSGGKVLNPGGGIIGTWEGKVCKHGGNVLNFGRETNYSLQEMAKARAKLNPITAANIPSLVVWCSNSNDITKHTWWSNSRNSSNKKQQTTASGTLLGKRVSASAPSSSVIKVIKLKNDTT